MPLQTTPPDENEQPLPAGARIAVTGANGLVGSALVRHLSRAGYDVVSIVRHPDRSRSQAAQFGWDPPSRSIDRRGLEGTHAVVHLAGENIAAGRWTEESRRRILASRAEGTQLL